MDKLDPEMLEQLDVLLEMDILEQEEEWPLMDDLESTEETDEAT